MPAQNATDGVVWLGIADAPPLLRRQVLFDSGRDAEVDRSNGSKQPHDTSFLARRRTVSPLGLVATLVALVGIGWLGWVGYWYGVQDGGKTVEPLREVYCECVEVRQAMEALDLTGKGLPLEGRADMYRDWSEVLWIFHLDSPDTDEYSRAVIENLLLLEDVEVTDSGVEIARDGFYVGVGARSVWVGFDAPTHGLEELELRPLTEEGTRLRDEQDRLALANAERLAVLMDSLADGSLSESPLLLACECPDIVAAMASVDLSGTGTVTDPAETEVFHSPYGIRWIYQPADPETDQFLIAARERIGSKNGVVWFENGDLSVAREEIQIIVTDAAITVRTGHRLRGRYTPEEFYNLSVDPEAGSSDLVLGEQATMSVATIARVLPLFLAEESASKE